VVGLLIQRLTALILTGIASALMLPACQPKIQIEAPKEPITINLNVKIEHEIRVKVDNDLEQLFDDDDGLF
jgi:hypothetical protein